MVTYQRILLATDFSDSSSVAVEHACLLAKTFHAELHVIHVLETDISMMGDGINYLPLNYFEEVEKQAPERLRRVVPQEYRSDLVVIPVLRRGAPFLELVQYARDSKADLIVMGTHGRGAVAHLLMGNVAEKVVRKAPCAVLTVRHPEHKFVMP